MSRQASHLDFEATPSKAGKGIDKSEVVSEHMGEKLVPPSIFVFDAGMNIIHILHV